MNLNICNIGPIQNIAIPLPDAGGVVVLRGANGVGKTHAIEAITKLESNEGSPPLRDGATKGSIEGAGIRINVAGRCTRTGELTMGHIEGADPSILVDPMIDDEQAADAERVRQLCEFAGVKPDVSLFTEIMGGTDEMSAVVRPETYRKKTLPDMADAFKRDCEAQARRHQDKAINLEAEARAHSEAAQGFDESEFHDVPAAQMEVQRAAEALTIERQRVQGLKDKVEGARAAQANLAAAKANYTGRASNAVQMDIMKEEADLLNLNERVAALREKLSGLRAEAKAAQDHELYVRSCEADIAGVPIDAPVDESQVKVLEGTLEFKQARSARAAVVDAALKNLEKSRRATADAQTARFAEQNWRVKAQNCAALVQQKLSAVAPQGMTVDEGRLVVQDATRGKIFFSELSHGQRWRLALHIALEAGGRRCLIPIRQEAWEGLDPENRAAVAEQAKEYGSVIITAEASSGPLRAEVYEAS